MWGGRRAAARLHLGLVAGEDGAAGAQELARSDALHGQATQNAQAGVQGLVDLLGRGRHVAHKPGHAQPVKQGQLKRHVVRQAQRVAHLHTNASHSDILA